MTGFQLSEIRILSYVQSRSTRVRPCCGIRRMRSCDLYFSTAWTAIHLHYSVFHAGSLKSRFHSPSTVIQKNKHFPSNWSSFACLHKGGFKMQCLFWASVLCVCVCLCAVASLTSSQVLGPRCQSVASLPPLTCGLRLGTLGFAGDG